MSKQYAPETVWVGVELTGINPECEAPIHKVRFVWRYPDDGHIVLYWPDLDIGWN